VSVVVYTKWPEMTEDRVISDLRDKQLIVTLYVKQSVYTVHIGKLRLHSMSNSQSTQYI